MPFIRSRHRDIVAVVILFGIVTALFACVLYVRFERQRLAPPSGITTFSGFLDRMPEPAYLRLVRKQDRDYVLWYGETMRPRAMASGRSCYIFDDRGHLVHWQPETGDGGLADDFCTPKWKEISLVEALELVQPAQRTN